MRRCSTPAVHLLGQLACGVGGRSGSLARGNTTTTLYLCVCVCVVYVFQATKMVMRKGGCDERTPVHHAATGCHADAFERLLEFCSGLPDAKVSFDALTRRVQASPGT